MNIDFTPRFSHSKPVRKRSKSFPLSIHKGSGYWCRKVRGKVYYFGKVANDPKGQLALEQWLEVKDDLLAGRQPRPKSKHLTLESLCNHFLESKERAVQSGELQPASWREYWRTCRDMLNVLGKSRSVEDIGPIDFERLRAAFAVKSGPVRLGKLVQIVRCVFRYGSDSGLILQLVRFGPGFKRPSKKVIRCHRAERGPKLFSREEVLCLLTSAEPILKAMILLGVNAGLGNTDIGRLETRHLDLGGAWLMFPRPKSGVNRRAKLWPETVVAIHAALAVRPTPKDAAHSDRVFVTKYGGTWAKDDGKSDPVALMFGRLLDSCKIKKRAGCGYYALRHTARTIMDQTKDFPAARLVMGHADSSIDDFYRETIDDSRLEAVSDHIHGWLFPKGEPR